MSASWCSFKCQRQRRARVITSLFHTNAAARVFRQSVTDKLFEEQGMEFFNDVGTDPTKPSLFELVAQEQLRDLLQPALKYVLSVRAIQRFLQFSDTEESYRFSRKDILDTFCG